jgi:succinate-acetate transporter protein
MEYQSTRTGPAPLDPLSARIYLRPIGSPLTIAMSGLAIGSLVQSGFDLRWFPVSQAVAVGVILLAAPFVLQLLASVFAYLARDGAAGAAIGVLATTWAGIGVVHLVSTPGSRSGALGLLLLAAGGLLALSACAVVVAKPLAGMVFLLASVRFVLVGIYQLGATITWRHVAGIVGLVVLGLAAYCVLAFELEGQQRKPVLPTFRRGRGAVAISEGAAAQLDGVGHEAGVRQTT